MALKFRGVDLTSPINRLAAGFVTMAVNIRAYLLGGFALRTPLSIALFAALPDPIHTIRRLNDSTPNGPASGYALVIGAGTNLYVWNSTIGVVKVAEGLSGNQLSMVAFRPNTSPQPWMYVTDSAADGTVTLITKYLISGDPVDFPSNGMMKVNANGTCWKMGVKEPQSAPVVSTANTVVPFGGGAGNLLATAIPWTNNAGANSGYDYGETNGLPDATPDGTGPFIVNVQNASYIEITGLSGTATVNGESHAPTDSFSSWVTSDFPAYFIQALGTGDTPPATGSVVVGAFTLGDDAFTTGGSTVAPLGVAPLFIPSVVDIGAAFTGTIKIPVPYGAVTFQIGINSHGNTFSSNSGAFTIAGTVTTLALPAVTSILGNLTLAYWDDSPTSGPVASYIWKNPDDPGGSGPPRSVSSALGTTAGNSLIFDATFTSGIPALPGIGDSTVPMLWSQLNPDSVVIGSNAIFAAPLIKTNPTNTQFDNFNFCLTGQIYFPAGGQYTFVLTNHDDLIWGIGGGVKLVSVTTSGSGEGSSASLSGAGQTITVVGGYPLLPRQNYTHGDGGHYAKTTVVVDVPAAGIYPFEVDYDYWYHSGRILLIDASPTPTASPTIIPPLPANIRQDVQVRYVYRSSATGAQSNPSPASAAQSIPVLSNTYTSAWSSDPQIDVVDYYRIDSTVSDYTYVNTGPNDDSGSGTNTPVSDSLTDTELGTQLLSYDNFEPFPSIDLPQKGVCNVAAGVITWVSGGAIGGTATGFNPRWLGGTTILIGSPTSLAYVLIARPVSNTITIPGVPDGSGLAYEIEAPTLAAQPMPYLAGPTDNVNYALGVGDTLRQGTLYWSAAGNLDAAPDTNQSEVTDPSEALVNVAISSGRGVLCSIRRWWTITPNQYNALATATGTVGSTWSLRLSPINRGLFIPRCLVVTGGGAVYARVDDGIVLSGSGIEAQSITDEMLYPLFPHEGSSPQPITRNGRTVFPPDDTLPQLQKFSYQNGYMYYDFQDTNGNRDTLVFDEAAMGWMFDISNPAATVHAANEGQSTQGTLVGCFDGTVRTFASTGTEVVTGTLLSAAIGGVGWQYLVEMTVEYQSQAPCTLSFIPADEGNGSYAPVNVTLPSTGGAVAKFTFKPSQNKWKLLQAQFQTTDPAFALYLEGTIVNTADWSGEAFKPIHLFAPAGGTGGEA